MNDGLTVTLHDPHLADAPAGWDAFMAEEHLMAAWSWPLVRAAASRRTVIAATVRYGPDVVGLITGRFHGPRTGRSTVPWAGIVDVDSLSSSTLPGITLAAGADGAALTDTIGALRSALREAHGGRVRGLMFRQVSAETLPALLTRPAIVREGGPIAWFPNRFASFEDYLRSLGRRRRYDLRRILAGVAASDLHVASTLRREPVQVQPAQLCELIASVVNRHHDKWWLPKRLMSPAMAAAQLTTPGVHLNGYRDGDRLIALNVIFDHPELPLSAGWGAFSVAEGGRRDLWYHNNLELARWCIDTGRRGFLSGQGSLVEKRRLGHEMIRQWAVLIPLPRGPR
ncbi:hypothetical protein [Micromonospora sp. WMMD708]|uniref:hypothetical protein n=1 Tax=Micromonospora sp. WMMD708 TaxID=3403464 RepID=UPI003BF5B02B